MRFHHLLAAAALFLAGCTSPADRAMRASPDYKAGYNDGCATAGSQGADRREDSMIRDDQAYRSNKAYHAGWGTGFNACRIYQPQAGAPPGVMRDNPIPDPTPGGMP